MAFQNILFSYTLAKQALSHEHSWYGSNTSCVPSIHCSKLKIKCPCDFFYTNYKVLSSYHFQLAIIKYLLYFMSLLVDGEERSHRRICRLFGKSILTSSSRNPTSKHSSNTLSSIAVKASATGIPLIVQQGCNTEVLNTYPLENGEHFSKTSSGCLHSKTLCST